MKEEILREIEVAEEELSSSYLLFENGKYRDSISRAYYAMFHAARALLLLKKVTPKKHSGVVSMFGLHYVKKGLVDEYYGKAITKALNLEPRQTIM